MKVPFDKKKRSVPLTSNLLAVYATHINNKSVILYHLKDAFILFCSKRDCWRIPREGSVDPELS